MAAFVVHILESCSRGWPWTAQVTFYRGSRKCLLCTRRVCHKKLVYLVVLSRSNTAVKVQSSARAAFLSRRAPHSTGTPTFVLTPWMTETDRPSHSEEAWFILLHPYSGQNSHLSLLLFCLFLKEGRNSFLFLFLEIFSISSLFCYITYFPIA